MILTAPGDAYWLHERLLTYPDDLLRIGFGGNGLVQDISIETGLQNYRDMINFCRDTYNSDASVLAHLHASPRRRLP